MESRPFQFYLFPHTTLPENRLRPWAVLLPHLHLLQVLRPPAIPGWTGGRVTGLPAVHLPEEIEQIRLSLKGYLDFADLHGEGSGVAAISHQWIQRGQRESRFSIQDELRGREAPGPGPGLRPLVEAAVFLEMARDFDDKNMELEDGLSQVESLEESFREVLGISDEDELGDVVETLTPPLVSDKAALSYMLSTRIASWLRLFPSGPGDASPVFVASSPEVLDEVMEPIRTRFERAGMPSSEVSIPLAVLPDLTVWDSTPFAGLLEDPQSSGTFQSFWDGLEEVLHSPHETAPRDRLQANAAALHDHLLKFEAAGKGSVSKPLELTAICLDHLTPHDFRSCLDRQAGQTGPAEPGKPGQPTLLLCLT